jgi:hypothetical protein
MYISHIPAYFPSLDHLLLFFPLIPLQVHSPEVINIDLCRQDWLEHKPSIST